MEWTTDQTRFVRRTLERLGNRVGPQHMSFLLKRHMNVSVTDAEVSELMRGLAEPAPQILAEPLKIPPKGRDLRGTCQDIINEIKAELGNNLHTCPVETTAEGLSALLVLSDLHIGEIIKVNGKTIFDLAIAEEKLADITTQFISAPELDGYEVEECIVLLAGDIIDGEMIYNGQSFDTNGHAFAQVKDASALIWETLCRLAAIFPVVKVYCVPGNHGRASKLHHQMSNWDNVLYFGLQLMADMAKINIEVHTPSQMWMDFKVRNYNVHTRHIGVVQASTSGPAKKIMTWMDGHDADLMFFGHFHSPELYSMGHRRIFKNGALPPANDFAEMCGFQDGSGQWMIGITDHNSVAFSKILIPG